MHVGRKRNGEGRGRGNEVGGRGGRGGEVLRFSHGIVHRIALPSVFFKSVCG